MHTATRPICYNRGMEHEGLQYKVVMDDGPDTEVLGRLTHIELADAAFVAAVRLELRHGSRDPHQGRPRSGIRGRSAPSYALHYRGSLLLMICGSSRRSSLSSASPAST